MKLFEFLKNDTNIMFYENEKYFSVKNYEQGSTISKFPVVIISKIINGNLCEFKNFLVKTLFCFEILPGPDINSTMILIVLFLEIG